MKLARLRGSYPADRASALSGVPLTTIHYWSRHEILVPSVSPERVKLWSYTDLMGLRTIAWLRRAKESDDGYEIPRSSMPAVRRALRALAELDLELWTEDGGPAVTVSLSGEIFIVDRDDAFTLEGQRALHPDLLDLIAPFSAARNVAGPDLQRPRPHLRIVPGKLSGSPHVARTRVETIAVAALAERGLAQSQIEKLYPSLRPLEIVEALDLERQLARNTALAA